MLDEVKQLREQANKLNKQAKIIEKEYFNNLVNEVIDKHFFDGQNTYYKITDFDGSLYNCFSLFFDDDKSICTEFEKLMPNELNRMKEITKEEAERAFDKLFKFSKREFIG
jgi:hypothetical protein